MKKLFILFLLSVHLFAIDNNTISTPANSLVALNLELNATSLNLGEKASVVVTGTFKDNTIKEVNDQVEWIIAPSGSVDINGTTLTTLKDNDTTIKAKVGNVVSNAVDLDIYWEVNGHRLPPEPDEALNNSTLLGIDVNNNDVRDDVERWIYKTYKDKHPIHIDIAMQAARAYKKVLETPEKAKEIHDEVRKPLHCQFYYEGDAKYLNDSILVTENIVSEYFRSKIYFNTQERKNAYNQYDTLLSGDSYTLPSFEEEKQACDFNTSKYEE